MGTGVSGPCIWALPPQVRLLLTIVTTTTKNNFKPKKIAGDDILGYSSSVPDNQKKLRSFVNFYYIKKNYK